MVKERAQKSARLRVSYKKVNQPAAVLPMRIVSGPAETLNATSNHKRSRISENVVSRSNQPTLMENGASVTLKQSLLVKRDSGISIGDASKSLVKKSVHRRVSQDRLSITILPNSSTVSDHSSISRHSSVLKEIKPIQSSTQSIPASMPLIACVDDSGFDRDPLMVQEYSNDIYLYLRQKEVCFSQ